MLSADTDSEFSQGDFNAKAIDDSETPRETTAESRPSFAPGYGIVAENEGKGLLRGLGSPKDEPLPHLLAGHDPYRTSSDRAVHMSCRVGSVGRRRFPLFDRT